MCCSFLLLAGHVAGSQCRNRSIILAGESNAAGTLLRSTQSACAVSNAEQHSRTAGRSAVERAVNIGLCSGSCRYRQEWEGDSLEQALKGKGLAKVAAMAELLPQLACQLFVMNQLLYNRPNQALQNSSVCSGLAIFTAEHHSKQRER